MRQVLRTDEAPVVVATRAPDLLCSLQGAILLVVLDHGNVVVHIALDRLSVLPAVRDRDSIRCPAWQHLKTAARIASSIEHIWMVATRPWHSPLRLRPLSGRLDPLPQVKPGT